MSDHDEKDVTHKSGVVYAAVLSLVFSVLALLLLGWALDRWLQTSPWLLVAGIVLGTIIGFVQFIRQISKLS